MADIKGKIPIKLKTTIPIKLKTETQSNSSNLYNIKLENSGENGFPSTITITFGDQAENHHGMQKLGQMADVGFSIDDLENAKGKFESKGYSCELINLNNALAETNIIGSPAAVLIVRNGLQCLLMEEGLSINQMFKEQMSLQWDSKAFMYGKVVNKKARHNLCYGDLDQEPDYEMGKGRVVAFDKLPCTNCVRGNLVKYLGDKANGLMAEGNLYYDISQCGIGWHGDAERKKVIAIRLGASMPLHYQWYQQSKPIGKRVEMILHHGDLYVMSEKATGYDWKKRKIATLRHAAGSQEFLK